MNIPLIEIYMKEFASQIEDKIKRQEERVEEMKQKTPCENMSEEDWKNQINIVNGRRQGMQWVLNLINKNFHNTTPTKPIRIYKEGDEVQITKDNGTVFARGEKVTVVGVNEQFITLKGADGLIGRTMIENIKHLN